MSCENDCTTPSQFRGLFLKYILRSLAAIFPAATLIVRFTFLRSEGAAFSEENNEQHDCDEDLPSPPNSGRNFPRRKYVTEIFHDS